MFVDKHSALAPSAVYVLNRDKLQVMAYAR